MLPPNTPIKPPAIRHLDTKPTTCQTQPLLHKLPNSTTTLSPSSTHHNSTNTTNSNHIPKTSIAHAYLAPLIALFYGLPLPHTTSLRNLLLQNHLFTGAATWEEIYNELLLKPLTQSTILFIISTTISAAIYTRKETNSIIKHAKATLTPPPTQMLPIPINYLPLHSHRNIDSCNPLIALQTKSTNVHCLDTV